MSVNKADAVILDCYVQSLEIIFKGRKAELIPSKALRSRVEQGNFSKPSDYYTEILMPWRLKPTLPLVVDIYCVYESARQLVLIEKWIFWYTREEGKDMRPVPNRKVQTFVRSLFSFMRLLPGYQLLSYRPQNHPPTMYFDVYHPDMRQSAPFSSPTSMFLFISSC
jgi:hypothetical protein